MDLKQLEYIVKIAEESSITRAAEQLYITQSGLNQQLLKLENELGIQLFHRSKNDFRLTEAGKVYVSYARKMLQLKQEAYNILNDMADNKIGHLRVGLTPERGLSMFVGIYPEFYKRYPQLTIEPLEISVKKQVSMISKGYLDLGFVTVSDGDKSGDEYIHIKDEELLLGIPRSHPMARHASAPGKPYTVIDLEYFKHERFVLMFKDSTMRGIIDPLFKEAGFRPTILFETASNRTLHTMAKNNMCCTIIPETYATEEEYVAYFRLPSHPTWELAATYKKGAYLTKAARDFIDLAVHFWNSI
ncbi:LysR family transcriptional regulator [Clostridium sp. AM58-1XD]|uniref:LysR family transcriptional regulator n=1 Tax=Clostridium sp. AM58-1XD TaxID=2292307 RepID=UPI000E50D936|nr:LysR family transcriptional regulator [Clostridium sp. AM58-1XD]RGY95778.1 LysR family transcriptional regulator [Clostridium sp. AM58-1XD]